MSREEAATDIQTILPLVDAWLEYQTWLRELPGISVGIGLGGETLFAKSYGLADIESGRTAGPDTMYRIASHSKLFTATAVMKLRAAGMLRLDDPIREYLDWFEAPEDENMAFITIRQLLTHSSGILRDGSTLHWSIDEPFPDRENLIEQLRQGGSVFEGNEHWKYSNIGYTLLGQVIESVTGVAFEEAVRDLVVDPLGLVATRPDFDPDDVDRHATGYGRRLPGRARLRLPQVSARIMNPATGFSSTVNDLLRFYDAHRMGNEILLSDRDKREMHRLQFKDKDYEWGLGFELMKIGETEFVGHGGAFPGFITMSAMNPETGLVIVVLTNAIDGPAWMLAEGIGSLIDAAAKKSEELSPGEDEFDPQLEELAGIYRSVWGDTIYLDINGRLVSIAPESERPGSLLDIYERTREGRYRVALRNQNGIAGETIHFEDGPEGAEPQLIAPGSAAVRIKLD